MKLSLIFLGNALFAFTILAAPDYLARRHAARLRSSEPFDDVSALGVNVDDVKDIIDTTYSNVWAGAVYLAPPTGETFNGVSTQFIIPPLSNPTGADGYWATAAWAGIDGYSFTTALFQSGVLIELAVLLGIPTVTLTAWYQWWPSPPFMLPLDFTLSVGDTISISVTSTSPTTGTVTITDITTGQRNTYPVNAPSGGAALAGQNTEWIVESLMEQNGTRAPLPDFGTFIFSSCVATTSSTTLNAAGAQLVDIETPAGTILTQSSIPNDSTVQVVFLNSA